MGGESPVSAYLVEPQTSRLHSAPTDVFGPFVGTDHAGTFIKLLLLDPEVVPVQKLVHSPTQLRNAAQRHERQRGGEDGQERRSQSVIAVDGIRRRLSRFERL